MGNNTLLAGAALMLLLLVPIWLSPQESLQPSGRTLILLGVAGGLVSIGAFEALRWNAPKLHIVAYPRCQLLFRNQPDPGTVARKQPAGRRCWLRAPHIPKPAHLYPASTTRSVRPIRSNLAARRCLVVPCG